MNELVVEGLTPEDFLLLKEIITTFNVSLSSDIEFAELAKLASKVEQIVKALSSE